MDCLWLSVVEHLPTVSLKEQNERFAKMYTQFKKQFEIMIWTKHVFRILSDPKLNA